MLWNSPAVRQIITLALKEDAAQADITTQTLIPADLKIRAEIRAKQAGVVCGLPLAAECFKRLDRGARFQNQVREGQSVRRGQTLAKITAKARAILSAERTALNALQHLSGIATFTAGQVARLHSRRTRIYDTRKTLPGWRALEKYAVKCGGGTNHRMDLKVSVLIKDNHLMLSRLAKTDWIKRIRALKRRRPGIAVELEIQSERDMRDAVTLKPDQVLLDNMSSKNLKRAIKRIRRQIPRAEIEISGGVESHQLKRLGHLGVERISMGRLTHSAPAFDCSLDITHVLHSR